MSEKIKKNNSGKTINFAEKKKSINSKKMQSNPPKGAYNDNRVIQYDINKMREQINQQTKKKGSKVSHFNSPTWVKAVYTIATVILIILIVARVTNNFGFAKDRLLPDKFVTQSRTVDEDDFAKYDKTIKSYLNSYVKADGDLNIKTTSMHKNNNYIYANGYFTYPNEKNKIYFDAVMTPDKMNSLIVNGYELTKDR
ncbi:hypothetical protein [Peptostreptococcus russellii]|uniref:hypothetical protein n=1 Tax=Peptostreptococcus russellii TaxID=215200 RepID=UPI0026F374EB|nr:hypothetical protein [Peptostreptococcus russellii]